MGNVHPGLESVNPGAALDLNDLPPAGEASASAADSALRSNEERSRLITALFREHNRALVSFLTARLHSPQDAKDVAQEAYVRLLQLDTPGALSFLRAYLFKIAENLAIDRIRHHAVRVRAADTEALLFDDLDEASSPERKALAQEELSRISDRLMTLPVNCREAFVMHVLLDRPVREIAAEMRLTDRMVRYYVTRGLLACQGVRDEMEPK